MSHKNDSVTFRRESTARMLRPGDRMYMEFTDGTPVRKAAVRVTSVDGCVVHTRPITVAWLVWTWVCKALAWIRWSMRRR